MQLIIDQYRGIVITLSDESNLNQTEELIRYVTNDFKHTYNFYVTTKSESSEDKSFRLYMIDKISFLNLPLYKYQTKEQKLHAYQCLSHDFSLRRKYELNGYKTYTLPLFTPKEIEYKLHTQSIGSSIVSIEANRKDLTLNFPIYAAHCYSNERELTSSPMTILTDPE